MTTVIENIEMDPNNNAQPEGEKCYSLRPRSLIKRSDSDEEEVITRKKQKVKRRQKQKPAPLSKYRRKNANARERSRMREINEAFDSLRRAVPHTSCFGGSDGDKLTKISTLRLAMKYISALSATLAEPFRPPVESDVESLISDSTAHYSELTTSEPSLTPPLPGLSSFDALDSSFSDPYSDFSDSTIPLDPYTDFSSFVLDDDFPADFS